MMYENKIASHEEKLKNNVKIQMEQFERELSFKFANEDDKAEAVLKEYLRDLQRENSKLKSERIKR
jgi:phosphoglycerol transferase MdoB-like AlkP superfamily enzyme